MVSRVQVVNDNETRQFLENVATAMHGDEMMQTMHRATTVLMNDARKFAPVDTGRLRASIAANVRSVGAPRRVEGVVGTNVEYAPYMEYGTTHTRMPPVSALEGWARRHNTSAYQVARAILRNGGLKAREFFKQSVDKNEQRVISMFDGFVTEVIRRRV